MENLWIQEKLERLKQQYSECGEQEVALSRYIGCMIRMLNGLAQMEYSQFHFYERMILWDAMEIFTEYFIEQIMAARCETDILAKRILIDDIENAVDRMTGVYKNVIDSTANSDRQILSSISIDTSIYELSPKICAFYSLILNKLVQMFEGKNAKYAFVLHPTLKNITETKIMFECRNKSGKVVIIYISESTIEMFDVVPVFLLHESFHVLTKEERMRKERIKYFIELMVVGMQQILFENVVFDSNARKNKEIQEKLVHLFFDDCKEEMHRWREKAEDSREFYSREVKQWANGYFHKILKIIDWNLEKWIREVISEYFTGKSYVEFRFHSAGENLIVDRIRENLLFAVFENKSLVLAKAFMSLFREIYADIACVLTLQLDSDNYKKAFENSKQFRSGDREYDDTMRMVRNYIVAEAVAGYLPAAESDSWKTYARGLGDYLKQNKSLNRLQGETVRSDGKHDPGENSAGSNTDCEKDSTFTETCVMLDVTPQMKEILLKYARGCAQAFYKRLESIENIQSFREFMLHVREPEKRDWLMKKIMIGDFSEIL